MGFFAFTGFMVWELNMAIVGSPSKFLLEEKIGSSFFFMYSTGGGFAYQRLSAWDSEQEGPTGSGSQHSHQRGCNRTRVRTEKPACVEIFAWVRWTEVKKIIRFQ